METAETSNQPEHHNLVLMMNSKPKAGHSNDVSQKLVLLASFVKELQTQSHLIHFNYEGSNFLDIHNFLKDQYDLHLEQFDQLGEFVRILNYWMPMCACGLKDALGSCFKNVESYDGTAQLKVYYDNLGTLENMIKLIQPAVEASDLYDVANYLAELLAQTSKACWMIRSVIRDQY